MKLHNKPLASEDHYTEIFVGSVDAKPKRKFVKKAKEVKPVKVEQNFTAVKKVKKSKPKVSIKLLVVITLIISFLSNLYVVYSIYQAKHSYATQDTQTVPKKEVPDVR